MNRKVVFDCDGCLADFEGAFCCEFGFNNRELAHLEYRYPNKARQINKFINDGFVYKNLQPHHLGLDIVEWLNEVGFEVHIVTSRPFGMERLTIDWLSRHGVKFSSFTLDRSKTGAIALARPLCAVDDLFSVHQALLLHNIPTILIAHPWNNYIGENITRINNLSQFKECFSELLSN